jgi:hypothetical protein
MPIQTKHGWKCFYCGKEYPTVYTAEDCLESHKIIYVPFAHKDVNDLLMYLFNPVSHINISKPVSILQRMLEVFNEKEKAKSLSDLRKGP